MGKQNVPLTVSKETVMRKTSENQMRPSAYNISGSAGAFNGGASISGGRFTQNSFVQSSTEKKAYGIASRVMSTRSLKKAAAGR